MLASMLERDRRRSGQSVRQSRLAARGQLEGVSGARLLERARLKGWELVVLDLAARRWTRLPQRARRRRECSQPSRSSRAAHQRSHARGTGDREGGRHRGRPLDGFPPDLIGRISTPVLTSCNRCSVVARTGQPGKPSVGQSGKRKDRRVLADVIATVEGVLGRTPRLNRYRWSRREARRRPRCTGYVSDGRESDQSATQGTGEPVSQSRPSIYQEPHDVALARKQQSAA